MTLKVLWNLDNHIKIINYEPFKSYLYELCSCCNVYSLLKQ